MIELPKTGDQRSADADILHSLIEAVVDYAIFRLDLEGRVQTWNSGAQRIKGYTAGEIIGQSMELFYTAEDRAAGRPAAALQAAATQGRFEDEAWRVRRDGSQFRAAVVIDAIYDAQGTLVGFAKVTRDVTERWQLERAREQLHRAQKLEIVGQLTAGLAHDFNNLLAAIIGSFDLIGRYTSDERIERILGTGVVAASRGQRLVAQMLAFAGQQALQPEPTDLNTLIAVLEELFRSAVGERIIIRNDIDTGLGPVLIDPAQFQSALLNLIVNARDAMPKGGELLLRTRARHLPEPQQLGEQTLPAGDYVQVEVIDNGIGMSAEVRARAIEPFYTTKPAGAGSGLGLSQVHGFAAQSGGLLEIESAPGAGTTIRMLLPGGTRLPQRAKPARSRAVLLVEDEPSVRAVAGQMLLNLGYEVHAAGDAVEALAMLERDMPIDLLFTDIVMPRGVNGDRLAELAIDLRPNLRVLLASAHPRPATRVPDGPGAEVLFLQKPYRMATLEKALKTLLPPSVGMDSVTSSK